MKSRWIMRIFFVLLGWFSTAQASTVRQLQGMVRSFPRSGSLEAHVFWNEKIWSLEAQSSQTQTQAQTPSWRYGFWRLGGFVATHGQLGLKAELYPLSIWQLSFQKSWTSRFYETLTLDCNVVECRGGVARTTMKSSLVLGYQDFFIVPSFSLTQISMSQKNKDFSSEEDNLVAHRLGDELRVLQGALGYSRGLHRWVLISKFSQMQRSHDHSHSQYFVWRRTIDSEFNYFVGMGQFSSNHIGKGFSIVAGANWSVGENLALF